jgi:NAD(P)H dehydrogenase (quinone)
MTEATDLMSRATGRPVAFRDDTDEEAFASRSGSGAAEFEVRGWVSSYWAIRDGSFAAVSDDMPRLTGRPATSLKDYLGAHPEALPNVGVA